MSDFNVWLKRQNGAPEISGVDQLTKLIFGYLPADYYLIVFRALCLFIRCPEEPRSQFMIPPCPPAKLPLPMGSILTSWRIQRIWSLYSHWVINSRLKYLMPPVWEVSCKTSISGVVPEIRGRIFWWGWVGICYISTYFNFQPLRLKMSFLSKTTSHFMIIHKYRHVCAHTMHICEHTHTHPSSTRNQGLSHTGSSILPHFIVTISAWFLQEAQV